MRLNNLKALLFENLKRFFFKASIQNSYIERESIAKKGLPQTLFPLTRHCLKSRQASPEVPSLEVGQPIGTFGASPTVRKEGVVLSGRIEKVELRA